MGRKRVISVEHNILCKTCSRPVTRVVPKHLPAPKYCCMTCYGLGKRYPYILKNGYKMVIKKGHPRANDHGYVREHILIMEEKLGRLILKGESIHHLDGDKTNNSPDNLILFGSHTEHLQHHWAENTLRKTNCGAHRLSD